MNVRFLGTFCAVARFGSLNAAARHLGLSSASVGEQIKALEKDLNARLVSRHGRGIVLTEAGHAVLPAARDVVERIDEMSQIAQLGQARGRLRVGAVSTAMIGVLPPALQRMTRHHPNVELNVYPGSSTHLYHRLEHGDLDCVITGRPSFTLPKSMAWYPIREEPLVLLCPASLEGDTIDRHLAAVPFIRLDRNAWTGQIVTRFLEDRAIRTKELFEMDAPATIVILVAKGVGASLLPDWGIAEPAGFTIRRLPVGDPAYDRQLGLIGLRNPRTRLIEIFAAALRDGAGNDTVTGEQRES
jgi:DNA-binding transcriptional LysR family regulator